MIRLSSAKCEEIKKEVAKLYSKYGLSELPIRSIELAKQMGIKVIPYSQIPDEKMYLFMKKSSDGFCVQFENKKWCIFYNDEIKSKERINNTIMHEIGHITLKHSEDSELAEKEVKFFAKYALAPPVLIHALNISKVEDIVKTFCVSNEAAKYALEYYEKWLRLLKTKVFKGKTSVKNYEKIILFLFKNHKRSDLPPKHDAKQTTAC